MESQLKQADAIKLAEEIKVDNQVEIDKRQSDHNRLWEEPLYQEVVIALHKLQKENLLLFNALSDKKYLKNRIKTWNFKPPLMTRDL